MIVAETSMPPRVAGAPSAGEQEPKRTARHPYPSARTAWFATLVLSAAGMVNFMDRGIITLLVDPIKADLHLGDTQISLLVGFAFVAFYVVLGLPIARATDTFCRKCILSTGIALWSVATASCAFAGTFVHLMLCRITQGVGETTLMPNIGSMLTDYFPRDRLPRAMSVVGAGTMIGTALALIGGGAAISWGSRITPLDLGIFTIARPWQFVFFLGGLPGLVVALLMLWVREPVRRQLIGSSARPASVPLISDVLALIRQEPGLFVPMFCGQALITMLSFGINTWMPAFFHRTYGWSMAEYGGAAGVMTLVCAPVGLALGAGLAEHLSKRGHDDAFVRTVMLLALAAVPFTVLTPLVPTAIGSLICLGVTTALVLATPSPAHAALLVATPGHMRGRMITLFAFVLNVVGAGLGPLLVALVTDYLFGDEAKVGLSLALIAVVLGPLSVLVQWKLLKPYGQRVAAIRAEEMEAGDHA